MEGFAPELNVLYTTRQATEAALEAAAELAAPMGAEIRLLALQVIPYPLPIGSPTVPVAFTARWLESLAARTPVRTRIQVYLCRDRRSALMRCLKPHALVVMGVRERWWPAWEERLARWLRAQGRPVLTAPAKGGNAKAEQNHSYDVKMPNSFR
jgi:hypothetical protein